MNGRCRKSSTRLRTAAAIAVAGLLSGGLLSGCAADLSFPAVHDLPAPRVDATMTPDQVKQVTDNLITEREHLSTEMQTSGTPQQPVPVPAAITGTVAARGQAQPAAGAQSPRGASDARRRAAALGRASRTRARLEAPTAASRPCALAL